MIDRIKELASAMYPEILEYRRHLHRFPELSFNEFETSKFIANELDNLGIPFESGWCKTGIVAQIDSGRPGRVVALRADMDALPIQEQNEVHYRSEHDGIMHACGHDVHMSVVLGATRILNELKDEWNGLLKVIFQPGEEKLPGGAIQMIENGVLRSPRPDIIIGEHVHPPLEAGTFGSKSGSYMASADEIYLTIKGKGGHGAIPNDCIDPVLLTAYILTALQQIVSRRIDPIVPAVLTFGKINSVGGATNVIPNEVKVEGTFRCLDESFRSKAHDDIVQIAKGTAMSMGGDCDVEVVKGYPVLVNDPATTVRLDERMKAFAGEENIFDLPARMSAEDFAYFAREVPSFFYRIGTGNVSRNIISPIHTDTFDIDEKALLHGIGMMAWLAWSEFNLFA